MYDYEVFTDRFRYQMTTFEVYILIALSGLLHDHNAYEIIVSKITTASLQDVGNDFPCRNVLKR